ncbi:acetamidase/formamidase family protein [Kineococcus glutinatus]|uniref:acetamidase/formamidase family protein n=1 Tax=Kineococcus glutinatus TaxID=1070872 RepID=UPI003CD05913
MTPTLHPLPGTEHGGLPYLPAGPGTVLWGRLPCDGDAPVLRVEPGRRFVVDTVSHEGILEDQGRDPLRWFAERGVEAADVPRDAVEVAATVEHDPLRWGPHVVTGPVEVAGARPGDVLSVTVEDLALRCGHGVVSNRHGRGALPGEFPLAGGTGPFSVLARVDAAPDATGTGTGSMPVAPGDARRVRFPLRPFLGLVGVATPGQRLHSVPPGMHGGNLDVSLLGVGSTLHLPVQVDGAGFYVGDPHYAQGDGEVALTAFEAPLRAVLRVDLVPAAAVRLRDVLWAETPELLVPIGLDPDLDEAVRRAVRTAVALLADLGMHPAHAYAYLSAAGDFAVSQVVDRVCGVHGTIRKADLAELLGARA